MIKYRNSMSIMATMFAITACTSYDDSLSAQEQANLTASQDFASQNNRLSLGANGNYTLEGQSLTLAGENNGQPVFSDITIDGTSYTIIASKYDYGLAIYALSPNEQFAEIGSDLDSFTSPSSLGSAQYAGKYTERNISASGDISDENSGAILLAFDPNAGTLTSLAGPDISYEWDSATNSFIGTDATTGETIAYEGDILLGHYTTDAGSGDTTYGTFFGLGE